MTRTFRADRCFEQLASLDNSVIVVENGEGEPDRVAAIRKICSEMHLNQTYLVLG